MAAVIWSKLRSVRGAEMRIHSVKSMRKESVFKFRHSVLGERSDTIVWRFSQMQRSATVIFILLYFISFLSQIFIDS